MTGDLPDGTPAAVQGNAQEAKRAPTAELASVNASSGTAPAEGATPLDLAHARMERGADGDRRNYYARLAEAELFVLLAREASGDVIEPRVFDLDSGPVVLAFDNEARLAGFAGGPAFYAAISGRSLVRILGGGELALGVNFGVEGREALLPPQALGWLASALDGSPRQLETASPAHVLPPSAPDALVDALAAGLAPAAGLAREALLADWLFEEGGGGGALGEGTETGRRNGDGNGGGGGESGHQAEGRRGWVVAFVGAPESAHAALAATVHEALVFSGLDGAAVDVAFPEVGDRLHAALSRIALRIDLRLRPREESRPGGARKTLPPRLR